MFIIRALTIRVPYLPLRMYGSPTDVKIRKLGNTASDAGVDIYEASFTTLTPAMRERFVGVNLKFSSGRTT